MKRKFEENETERTKNRRVKEIRPLLSPAILTQSEIKLSDKAAIIVEEARLEAEKCLMIYG